MYTPKYREEGSRLKSARQTLNLTQQELADAIGASLATVKGYERGMRIPKREFAIRLAKAGINMNFVFEASGPATLEGDARSSQAQMLTRALPDESGVNREPMVQNSPAQTQQLDRLHASSQALTQFCEELNYTPPVRWIALLQELMLVHGLSTAGAKRLIDTLRAERKAT